MAAAIVDRNLILEIESVLEQRSPRWIGGEIWFRCPLPSHPGPDAHPSARWNPQKTVFFCDVCQKGGGANVLAHLFGLSPDNRPNSEIIYQYSDEEGSVIYEVVRDIARKRFFQRRPDGNGGYVNSVRGVRRIPYRLPELIEAPKDEIILIVEGEKDADRARKLGFVATTNSGGQANGTKNGLNILMAAQSACCPTMTNPDYNMLSKWPRHCVPTRKK